MNKSEIAKSNNSYKVGVSGYISSSMIIKNNHKKSNDTVNDLLFSKTIERSENIRAFDIFAHILEG